MAGNKFQKNIYVSHSFHLNRDNSKQENMFMNKKINITDDQTELYTNQSTVKASSIKQEILLFIKL